MKLRLLRKSSWYSNGWNYDDVLQMATYEPNGNTNEYTEVWVDIPIVMEDS